MTETLMKDPSRVVGNPGPGNQNLLTALGLKVPGKAGDRSPVSEGSLLSRQQKMDLGAKGATSAHRWSAPEHRPQYLLGEKSHPWRREGKTSEK